MSSEQVSTGQAYTNLTETGLFLKKLVSFDHKSGRQLRKSRCGRLASVASVSNRVIARKLERKRKKKGGRGRGRGEEETLARKPHHSEKRPLIFHGSARL